MSDFNVCDFIPKKKKRVSKEDIPERCITILTSKKLFLFAEYLSKDANVDVG